MKNVFFDLHHVNSFMWYKADLVYLFPDNGNTSQFCMSNGIKKGVVFNIASDLFAK